MTPPVGRAPTRRELRALKAAEAAGVASQLPAIHIGDRWSAAFVLITLLVFVLIGLNGLLFGTNGAFNPYVSPSPAPSASPSAPSSSASPAVSAPQSAPSSPAASGSPAAASPAPSGSGSAPSAPSASPSP